MQPAWRLWSDLGRQLLETVTILRQVVRDECQVHLCLQRPCRPGRACAVRRPQSILGTCSSNAARRSGRTIRGQAACCGSCRAARWTGSLQTATTPAWLLPHGGRGAALDPLPHIPWTTVAPARSSTDTHIHTPIDLIAFGSVLPALTGAKQQQRCFLACVMSLEADPVSLTLKRTVKTISRLLSVNDGRLRCLVSPNQRLGGRVATVQARKRGKHTKRGKPDLSSTLHRNAMVQCPLTVLVIALVPERAKLTRAGKTPSETNQAKERHVNAEPASCLGCTAPANQPAHSQPLSAACCQVCICGLVAMPTPSTRSIPCTQHRHAGQRHSRCCTSSNAVLDADASLILPVQVPAGKQTICDCRKPPRAHSRAHLTSKKHGQQPHDACPSTHGCASKQRA